MMASNRQSQSSDTTGFSSARTIDRLSEQAKFGHEAWMERLREMQNVEAKYTKELLAARDPNEVLKICNRWIGKRLELLTADSKAFTGFWMDLVMTAAGGTQPLRAAPHKGEDA
jgi:hypothetical protein